MHLHGGEYCLHHPYGHGQVDGHDSLPFVLVDRISTTPSVAYASTIDQNIDAIVLANALGHGMLDRLSFSKVGLIEAKSRKVLGKLLRLSTKVDAKDGSSAFQEETCGCKTDTGAAAGDYGNFILERSDGHRELGVQLLVLSSVLGVCDKIVAHIISGA